jgi:hypothetical protein
LLPKRLFLLYDCGPAINGKKIKYVSIFNIVETPRFQKVANKSDLKEGGLLAVEIDDKRVVMSMVEGEVYAMNSVC